jgi:hypothetical protein
VCSALVDVLLVDGVTVVFRGTVDNQMAVHATDQLSAWLDEVQFTAGEGPCRDAYQHDAMVLVADLTHQQWFARWPVFTEQALAAGARAVFAFPVRSGGHPVAVLELYRAQPGALSPETADRAAQVATAMTPGLIQDLADGSPEKFPLIGGLQVPQATGIVAAQTGDPMPDALARLRAAAFAAQRPLRDIAAAVVNHDRDVTTDNA